MTFELLDTEESSDENNCPEMRVCVCVCVCARASVRVCIHIHACMHVYVCTLFLTTLSFFYVYVFQKWQSYVEKYSKPEEEASPELREILANRKVFLKR